MFKVTKILNSSKGAPEITYLYLKQGESYKKGTLVTFKSGWPVNCTQTDMPTHIILADVENAPYNYSVPAIPLTPDVIVETVGNSYASIFHIGEKYALNIIEGYAVGIKNVKDGGVATIFSNYSDSNEQYGKVCVRFV